MNFGTNEYLSYRVMAKCRSCTWSGTGEIFVERKSEQVSISPLVLIARRHHVDTGHIDFDLCNEKGKEAGFMAVSSSRCSGFLYQEVL